MLTGLVMQIGNYDGTLEVQSAGAQTAITLCYAGIPAIMSIAGILIMLKYNLGKRQSH